MSGLVLVTGATGFIGSYVVRRLVSDGAAVRVFVRRPHLLPPDLAARVQIHHGDLRDDRALHAAVDGCDTVLHLAACARAWCAEPATFQDVNLHAVESLLHAVHGSGVRRLVHVSTVLTLQDAGNRALTPYEETKIAGERLVARSKAGIIVHPTRVFGPGPLNDANGVTKVIAAYLAGRFRIRLADGDVQANYVHVDDVARGILLAARHGTAGEHYVLGGENTSMRGLLERVAALSGVHRRVLPVRPAVAIAAAAAAEAWGRLGGSVPITRDWVRLFLEDQRVDAPAIPTGYTPRSLDDGLLDTIGWLRMQPGRAA